MVRIRSLRLRLVAVMAAAILPGIGLAPSVAQEASPTTRHFQVEQLQADFVLDEGKAGVYKWIGVNAARYTNPETGQVTFAGRPFRGTCVGDYSANMSCSADGLKGWRVTRFEADKDMNAGLVVLKKRARTIRIRFTGSDPFTAEDWTYENSCGGTTTDDYTLTRSAMAEGRMFGRRVSTKSEAKNSSAEQMKVIDRTERCA